MNVSTNKRFYCAAGAAIIILFISFAGFAQQYSIGRYKVSGGGGTSTNSQYTVTGTIGQADASGTMSGGSYSVAGGFWSAVSVVQTTGAPTLLMSHSGNTVTVYWQNISGWNLRQNNDLSLPANWSLNTGWTTSNGTNYLNIVNPSGNLFFRLQNP